MVGSCVPLLSPIVDVGTVWVPSDHNSQVIHRKDLDAARHTVCEWNLKEMLSFDL